MLARGAVEPVALLRHHPRPPVGADVRHAGEFHVVLPGDGVGDALADDAVAVDGDAGPAACVHSFLPQVKVDTPYRCRGLVGHPGYRYNNPECSTATPIGRAHV